MCTWCILIFSHVSSYYKLNLKYITCMEFLWSFAFSKNAQRHLIYSWFCCTIWKWTPLKHIPFTMRTCMNHGQFSVRTFLRSSFSHPGQFLVLCIAGSDNSPSMCLHTRTKLRTYFKVNRHVLDRHDMISLLCIDLYLIFFIYDRWFY